MIGSSIASNELRSRVGRRSRSVIARMVVGVLVASVLVVVPAGPVAAQTETVDDETELRAAFANPDVTEILVTDSIELTCTGDSELVRTSTQDLEVRGIGTRHTISRDLGCPNAFRLMDVSGTGTLTINNLALTGGRTPGEVSNWDGGAIQADGDVVVTDSTFHDNAGNNGGAIRADGNVGVINSTFSGNTAGSQGGAIRASNGDVVVTNSTFTNNEVGDFDGSQGGAIRTGSGNVVVTNSTFTNNTAIRDGGAIWTVSGGVVLTYVTLVGNAASSGANLFMSGGSGTLEVFGSVIAAPGGAENCELDNGVVVVSEYGYADDGSCGLGGGTNREDLVDPGLGSLDNNGGPTLTMVPGAGSPLVDVIPLNDCDAEEGLVVDQRFEDRPQGVGCDVGAVEVENDDVAFPLGVTTTLVADSAGGVWGTPVTLSAVVDAVRTDLLDMPSGTVQFVLDGVVLDAVPLSSGVAVLSHTFDVGVHGVVAVYSGDEFFDTAASDPVTITVTGPPPPPPPPVESAPACVDGASSEEAFVCQVYLDLLHRPAEPGGLAYWVGRLGAGTSPAQLVGLVAQSEEFNRLEVADVYAQLLGRSPDAAGLAHFAGVLGAGVTVEQVLATVAASPEYVAAAGSTAEPWLTALYRDLLGRAPDAIGLEFFSVALQVGVPPIVVAHEIATSTEARARLVVAIYDLLLGRSPDPTGLAFWVGILNAGATRQQVLAAIASSNEYQHQASTRHG